MTQFEKGDYSAPTFCLFLITHSRTGEMLCASTRSSENEGFFRDDLTIDFE